MKNIRKEKRVDVLRINEAITVPEVQVIDQEGKHMGVLPINVAIKKAKDSSLDLIEVSAKAVPPVVQITDYGKYLYNQSKKSKEVKSSHKEVSKTKVIQIKPGTGNNELELRGRKIGEWISKGHRVRIDLFLWGRYKYMDKGFLKERLDTFLPYIKEAWEIAEPMKESPKGFSVVVQRSKKNKNKENENKQIIKEEIENNKKGSESS